MKVYVVMIGWDYEGEELDMVFGNEVDAERRVEKLEKDEVNAYGDYRAIRVRELK